MNSTAAQARAAAVRARADRPSQRSSPKMSHARTLGTLVIVRSIEPVARGDRMGVLVGGIASTTEQPYEMMDCFGPYDEVVSRDAFDATLATNPLVEFTVNHGAGGGMPMAHTRNGTLSLAVTDVGLEYEAYVDASRTDVANLLSALERGDLAESSFRFQIKQGLWSPDFTVFRIAEVDLDRGDVSAVNVGANPNTTSGLRSAPAAPIRKTLADMVDRLRD